MTTTDFIIWLIVGAALVLILIFARKQRDLQSETIEESAPHADPPRFPGSATASLLYLFGAIAVVLGLVAIASEGIFQGAMLIGGAVSLFALGSGLQYLFDIRTLLMRREDRDDA